MSANTYAGNQNNYPALIHKVETGDPTLGGTWQVPVSELADRTAYLSNGYERVFIYSNPGTYSLNLTGTSRLFAVEFTAVGGGQGGGRSSAAAHGYGGMAGAFNRLHIPLIWDNTYNPTDAQAFGILPTNFKIVVGTGGAGGATTLYGNRGIASYVTDNNIDRPFLFAQGGGFVDQDATNYGTGYIPPPSQAATWIQNAYNDYASGGTKLPEHVRKHGLDYGFAQQGMLPGGYRGRLTANGDAANAGGQAGFGAGAGGGGGIATAGAGGGTALQGTGGHGGYGVFPSSLVSDGSVAATVANGGAGASGLVIARIFYR